MHYLSTRQAAAVARLNARVQAICDPDELEAISKEMGNGVDPQALLVWAYVNMLLDIKPIPPTPKSSYYVTHRAKASTNPA
jgi:hypothetical protein